MLDIQMTVKENFASFSDKETGKFVFVDSFDNVEFYVRLGTILESQHIGTVTALSDEDLTRKLNELVKKVL